MHNHLQIQAIIDLMLTTFMLHAQDKDLKSLGVRISCSYKLKIHLKKMSYVLQLCNDVEMFFPSQDQLDEGMDTGHEKRAFQDEPVDLSMNGVKATKLSSLSGHSTLGDMIGRTNLQHIVVPLVSPPVLPHSQVVATLPLTVVTTLAQSLPITTVSIHDLRSNLAKGQHICW